MILQYTDSSHLKVCPRCNAEGVFDYGDITYAPIASQIEDNRRGVMRIFKARRCFCPHCRLLWDVVSENREVQR